MLFIAHHAHPIVNVTFNLRKVSHSILQKIKNRVFRLINFHFCFYFCLLFFFFFLEVVLSETLVFFTATFELDTSNFSELCLSTISTPHLITTSLYPLHLTLALHIILSLHLIWPLSLISLIHLLIEDNCIGHDKQHTAHGSSCVRWCRLREDRSSHKSYLQSRTVQETSTFMATWLILMFMMLLLERQHIVLNCTALEFVKCVTLVVHYLIF